MRMILPEAGDELDDFELAEAYAYPRERWLRTNMVMSADGAGSLNGLSGGLSAAGDKRVFGILRVLADVVLVGSGTAEAESYKPARPRPALASLRAGRPATATIAVISGSLDLELDSPLFTEAPPDARTIVITREAARPELRATAAKAADVIVAGQDKVDLAAALAALADRGLRRVNCEGGPHLLSQVVAAGLLDELTLTVSPTLAGPGAGRIVAGAAFAARPLTLAQVLADDGYLFCRYLVEDVSLPQRRRRPPEPRRNATPNC
jgi:riboflavin biosynthesis pyrimidine reductase